MPHARIVVIGASAGGFEAAQTVLRGLPADFPAAVLVVIHTGPSGILPLSLARGSPLPVMVADDSERLEPGRVYVASPDRHLTVTDGVVRAARGPREHGFRPAIDPLFTTAAKAAGPRAAGVILSGALSDGTAGLRAIKQAGGLTVVQAPEEAAVPIMPASALRRVAVDAVLPVAAIGRALAQWAVNGARRGSADHRRPGGRGESDVRPQLRAITGPSRGGVISEVGEGGVAHDAAAPAARLVVAGDTREADPRGRGPGTRARRRPKPSL